jgi:hypothetical protein
LNEDILMEYLRYIAGSNEVTRKLWEIVQDENVTSKTKIPALSLLMQCYNKRLEVLIGAPYMNAKKSVSEIKFQERVDSDPTKQIDSKHHLVRWKERSCNMRYGIKLNHPIFLTNFIIVIDSFTRDW